MRSCTGALTGMSEPPTCRLTISEPAAYSTAPARHTATASARMTSAETSDTPSVGVSSSTSALSISATPRALNGPSTVWPPVSVESRSETACTDELACKVPLTATGSAGTSTSDCASSPGAVISLNGVGGTASVPPSEAVTAKAEARPALDRIGGGRRGGGERGGRTSGERHGEQGESTGHFSLSERNDRFLERKVRDAPLLLVRHHDGVDRGGFVALPGHGPHEVLGAGRGRRSAAAGRRRGSGPTPGGRARPGTPARRRRGRRGCAAPCRRRGRARSPACPSVPRVPASTIVPPVRARATACARAAGALAVTSTTTSARRPVASRSAAAGSVVATSMARSAPKSAARARRCASRGPTPVTATNDAPASLAAAHDGQAAHTGPEHGDDVARRGAGHGDSPIGGRHRAG